MLQWVVAPLLSLGCGLVGFSIKGRWDLRQSQAQGETGVEQKKIETEPTILQEVREQLREVREQLRECRQSERLLQGQMHQLKSDMQTIWFGLELVLEEHPESEPEVRKAIRQMKERQKEFLRDEEAAEGKG